MNQHVLAQYRAAESLEQYLGDPANEENSFSFKWLLKLDEQEQYPEKICDFLNQWKLYDYFIPTEYGGKLASFEEALSILRLLSRRDLTVAIALGQTYLGSVHIWLAGTEQQKRRVSQLIKKNRQLAFALTERAHGSDILANETHATPVAEGYLLSGEKWLINNGTRAAALTVFAKTKVEGGPRGFSLFLFDKEHVEKSSFKHIEKVKTHGIRGADISGICFSQSLIAAESRVGEHGSGLETALKGLMITRTLCAGFSLGAADSALRLVLDFALSRRLYGEPIFVLPYTERVLVDALADLLICDCLGIAAARGLHVVPEQYSIWSAIVKYFIPTTIESMIKNLSVVLGARHYLREGNWGIFQKMVRDNAVVGLFDGSTVVNLNAITLQLANLMDHREKIARQDGDELEQRLAAIFSLERSLPSFESSKMMLFNRGRDDILQGLPIALNHLDSIEDTNGEAETVALLKRLASEIVEQVNVEARSLRELTSTGQGLVHKRPEMFELAKRYCVLHAAAACLHIWVYNRKAIGGFLAKGEWLVLCLDRLLMGFHPDRGPLPAPITTHIAEELVRLHRLDKLFSIVPFQLARVEKADLALSLGQPHGAA